MSKELAKSTKEFAAQQKEASTLRNEYMSAKKNREHFQSRVMAAADEVTRVVQKLRKEGQTGATLKDFAGDKELKVVLAEVEDSKKQMQQINDTFKAMQGRSVAVCNAMLKLADELKEEIDARTKKKDRKVFAVDSKSLPDLEKLEKTIREEQIEFHDEIAQLIDQEAKITFDPGKIDTRMETAAKNTSDYREKQDDKDLDNRSLDLRILKKYLTIASSQRKEVTARLTEALQLLKGGDKDRARDAIAAATKAREEVQDIAEKYAKALKGINAHDRKTMEESKDGKQVFAMTDAIAKLDEEAGRALNGVLTKVKF